MWIFDPSKLREVRKAKGWSLKEAESAIGTSLQLISLWELGKKTPSTRSLVRMCNVYGVVPAYFFSHDVPSSIEQDVIGEQAA